MRTKGMATLMAATIAAGIGSATAAQAGTVTVKGSDTMVVLGQRWAEEYMKAHPDAVIQVTCGGSGNARGATPSTAAAIART